MAANATDTTTIAQRGYELYERTIKHLVDIPENRGKVIVIDVDSGDYEIDPDHLTAATRAKSRNPNAELFATRIGFPALGRLGGHYGRTAQ